MTSTAQRLRAGAKLLGELWRSGERCASEWRTVCSCAPKTTFCRAKEQWVALAYQDRPDEFTNLESPYVVLEVMKASELHETGITIKIDTGLQIGPKGGASVTDAAHVVSAPQAAPAVLKVLANFPGAMVVKSGAQAG